MSVKMYLPAPSSHDRGLHHPVWRATALDTDEIITLSFSILYERMAAISAIEVKSHVIEVNVPIIACRDPKDDKFLALAMAVKADCIVNRRSRPACVTSIPGDTNFDFR